MFFKNLGGPGPRPGMLDTAVREFLGMVDHSHRMYGRAGQAIWGTANAEDVRTEVYERDIQVNKAERAVRKAIVGHLAVNPSSETTLCLILMSVAKDAERIGDYCKNMMDLSRMHGMAKDANPIVDELKRMQVVVDALFPDVAVAFRDSDANAGGALLKREREATRSCDKIVEMILDAPSLTNRQVVTYTLLARYHKRIAAHLGNIASSLVMPLHKLDYFDEEHLPGQESAEDDPKTLD